jgi:hypothetical protein
MSLAPGQLQPHPGWSRVGRHDWDRAGVHVAGTADRPVFRGTVPLPAPAGYRGAADAFDRAHAASGNLAATLDRGTAVRDLDPFLEGLPGISSYRNTAQREAVRAALRCPLEVCCTWCFPRARARAWSGSLEPSAGTTTHNGGRDAHGGAGIDQERKLLASQLVDGLPDRLAYLGSLWPTRPNASSHSAWPADASAFCSLRLRRSSLPSCPGRSCSWPRTAAWMRS